MKKQSEIDFIKNGLVQIPIAIGHSNVDVDYITGIKSGKLFDEHMVMEIAGKLYSFIAEKRSESWSYIDEGEGIWHALDRVDDYHLHCDTIDHSCEVQVKSNQNYTGIGSQNINPFDGKPSHVRMERFGRKLVNSGFSYFANHHSEQEEYQDKNNILDIALATHLSALSDRAYQRNWKGMDKWRNVICREDIMSSCPGSPSYVEAKINVTHSNLNTFANHISFHNPHFDMKLMADTCDILNEIESWSETKEKGSILKDKMLDLLGKFDRETQQNMVRMLKTSAYPKVESFIERNHKKVFEPKVKREPEPTM